MKLRIAICLACLVALAGSAAGELTVQVFPVSPKQGETMFIYLSSDQEITDAGCRWDSESYPFFAMEERIRAVVPVSALLKAESHQLQVWAKHPDGSTSQWKRMVQVKPVKFGIQYLKLSRQKHKLYTHAGVQEEYRLIRGALAIVSPLQLWEGDFMVPVPGRVTTKFGVRRITNGQPSGWHRGVDIATPQGTPIKAANHGKVTLARDFKMHGKTVIIDHGHGVSTLYLHLSQIRVMPGQEVKQGYHIGAVGETGVSTAPHLHWGLYVHRIPVSPFFWTDLLDSGG